MSLICSAVWIDVHVKILHFLKSSPVCFGQYPPPIKLSIGDGIRNFDLHLILSINFFKRSWYKLQNFKLKFTGVTEVFCVAGCLMSEAIKVLAAT